MDVNIVYVSAPEGVSECLLVCAEMIYLSDFREIGLAWELGNPDQLAAVFLNLILVLGRLLDLMFCMI